MNGTTSVLIILTVPDHWPRLSEQEIERRIRANPAIVTRLAQEVKRWGGSGVIDLSGLQRFIDERTGRQDG